MKKYFAVLLISFTLLACSNLLIIDFPGPDPCEDLCGDNVCQEVVCEAEGCPCAESAETCPDDCGCTGEVCSTPVDELTYEEDQMIPDLPEAEPEEDEENKEHAEFLAMDYVMNTNDYKHLGGRELEITSVTQGECADCWSVELEYVKTSDINPDNDEKVLVRTVLENGEISSTETEDISSEYLSPDDCEDQGGRVDTGGEGCDPEWEERVGVVDSFDSPGVCCIPVME